jgi:F-type H+-transporting ATPase subunit epsilon
MSQLQCILVTPDATLRDAPADFVALPLFEGEIGIAPGHSPMIGRLGYGEMRIKQGQSTICFYVEGGFVEVLKNTVSVIAGRALPAESLDETAAEEQLAAACASSAKTPEAMALRERAVAQARARLQVARRAAHADLRETA